MKRFIPLILIGSIGLGFGLIRTAQMREAPETNQVLAQVPKIVQPMPQPLQPILKENKLRLPSPVKGILIKMLVNEGDAVKKGELLAQLDDRLAQNQVKAAQAKVLIAQEELQAAVALAKEAKAQLERLMKLGGPVSQEELAIKKLVAQRYEHEAIARMQALEVAKLEQDKAQLFLSMYRLESPVNGTVRKLFKQAGEAVGELETVMEISLTSDVPKVKKILKVPSRVKGIITKVLVQEGRATKQGDLLAQVEDQLAMNDVKIAHAQLTIAQAEYKSTEATLKEAEKQLQRLKMLPKGVVSQEEIAIKQLTFERYKYEAEARKQGVQLAQLKLENAELKASMFRIQAPVEGIIVNIHRQPGEAVRELETVIEIAVSEKK